jgi:hypothetical protein
MKKLYTYLAFIIAIATFAQAPQGFNYQATVRNSSGALIVNQNVNFKFNIMQNSPTAVPVYSETHYVPTDDLGAVNLIIGQGTPATGTFASINWGSGNYYMGIELNTGSGFVAMGTTQLLSVPYALYANSSGNSQSQGKTSIVITGNITDAQAAAQIAKEFGPYTENLYIRNTTGLTTLDLSAISRLINFSASDNANLTTINFSGLTAIFEYCNIHNNQSLTLISFPVLTISPSDGEFSIYQNPVLTSTSFSVLATLSEINIFENPLLSSISFPLLATVSSSLGIQENSSLKSFGLPSLSSCKSIYLNSNALPSSQINAMLNKFLTVTPASTKSIDLGNQTPPAPPTGQGIIDKQTLLTAGNSVATD